MHTEKRINNIWIPVFITMTGILFSCVNDLDTIQKVTYDPKAPDEVIQNLELHYTDSGYARVRVYAKLAEMYSTPKDITKLKDGLRVDFYSADGEITSTLTALYGEMDNTTGMVFVRDSVQLKNVAKKQLLETEELFWNQGDSTIFTHKNVVVTEPNKVAYGQGIKTNQEFSFYEFIKPYGRIDEEK